MTKASATVQVTAPGPLPLNIRDTSANCQRSGAALESADIPEDFL